ncbi:MAG: hypothetical protein UE295_04960, partial [Acutalibacteraceae bacterium]|nr:hypothetical protein [Acutalibacteraceae bacterium]
MKEIGGYFGLEQLVQNEYYNNLIALNTARNALLYTLKSKNIKKIYLPYFLCDSVSHMCDVNHYEYEYYYIDNKFLPRFEKQLKENEYLYIVNYYGQLDNNVIQALIIKHKNIIVDNVQAFFQPPIAGIDTIYSCRKFFGVPDGAYLSTNQFLPEELEIDISSDRMTHLFGRFESNNASKYYSHFQQSDESFEKLHLKKMSLITKNLLGAIDYSKVKLQRDNNFILLDKYLSDKNPLKLNTPAGPYAYPFYCEDGLSIKKKLAENKIYIPTLWPNTINSKDSIAEDFAKNILPLP